MHIPDEFYFDGYLRNKLVLKALNKIESKFFAKIVNFSIKVCILSVFGIVLCSLIGGVALLSIYLNSNSTLTIIIILISVFFLCTLQFLDLLEAFYLG